MASYFAVWGVRGLRVSFVTGGFWLRRVSKLSVVLVNRSTTFWVRDETSQASQKSTCRRSFGVSFTHISIIPQSVDSLGRYWYNRFMQNHTPQDGEVFALSPGDNTIRAEFVDSDGRIAWRLYDRFGKGIMLTEEQMRLMACLIANGLATKDSQ